MKQIRSKWMPFFSAAVVIAMLATQSVQAELLEKSKKVAGTTVQYRVVLPNGYDPAKSHSIRALVPGSRLICVVGDVCLSRRTNNGRHTVVPLHASIQEQCRILGFDNLAPIIWHKIAKAVYEVEKGSSFLGKPYEPNSVSKNDS
jgi:hypothetical protein